MILRLSLDLPEDEAYLRLGRLLGADTLQYMNVVPDDIEDIKTIIDELASNVIRHAQSEEGRFHLVLEYHAAKMVIKIKDRGKGFSFADIPPPGTVRPDRNGGQRIGGYGLKIVDALTDRLEFYRIDHQGTTVRAEKKLSYVTPAAAADAKHLDEDEGSATVRSR